LVSIHVNTVSYGLSERKHALKTTQVSIVEKETVAALKVTEA